MLTASQDFNQFLKDNALWLCLGIVGIIILVLAITVIIALVRRKKKLKDGPKKRIINASAYISALGGADNIVSHELMRSRIVLVLKNYDIVDKEKLKEAGVDGFIMMSEKLTLVIKGDAEAVNKAIFPEG